MKQNKRGFIKTQVTIAVIVVILSIGWLPAEMITPDMATTVAQAHVESMRNVWSRISQLEGQAVTIGDLNPLKDAESQNVLGYVVALEPRGFVVVSGETNLTPIIAYSYRSRFPWQEDPENTLLNMVRTDLALRLEALSVTDASILSTNDGLWRAYLTGNVPLADTNQWPPVGSTSTGGWLETTWSQRFPWRDYCPLDPSTGERCAVGCTATAMAQIVNYHSVKNYYLGDIEFGEDDRYVTDTRKIRIDQHSGSRDFPSFPVLNEYLDTLADHYSSGIPLDDHDLATLSFACGVSVEMDYTSEGSSASLSDAADAFRNKFKFFSAQRVKTKDVTWFYDTLKQNMKDALPAELEVWSSDDVYGHAIVCDGVREISGQKEEYHLNYGWGDDSPAPITEAWYSLPEGLPQDPYPMNIVRSGIINILPPDRAWETLELAYDDGEWYDYRGWYKDPGDIVSVRLTPPSEPSDTAWKLKTLRYRFGDIAGPIKARVFTDSSGTPDADLIAGFNIQPYSEWTWYDVDVSSYGIEMNGEDFYVALEYLPNTGKTYWTYTKQDNGRAWFYDHETLEWERDFGKSYAMRAVIYRETGWEPGVEEELVIGPVNALPLIEAPELQHKSVNFSYDISNPTDYVLSVFDVSGRQVFNHNGHMDSGGGRISLNPELTQGVYFWRIETELGVQSGKFVWLR